MKEERKAAKQEAAEQAEAEDADQPGVTKLSGSRVLPTPAKTSTKEAADEVEDERAPLLFDASIPTLQAALEQADVFLEVVDARDPLGFRSPWLEEQFMQVEEGDQRKLRVVVVLTKIGSFILFVFVKVLLLNSFTLLDLAPKESLTQWVNYLRPRFPTVLFKSAIPDSHIPPARSGSAPELTLAPSESLGREDLLETLRVWAEEKRKKTKKGQEPEEFVVTVAGLPNVRLFFLSYFFLFFLSAHMLTCSLHCKTGWQIFVAQHPPRRTFLLPYRLLPPELAPVWTDDDHPLRHDVHLPLHVRQEIPSRDQICRHPWLDLCRCLPR